MRRQLWSMAVCLVALVEALDAQRIPIPVVRREVGVAPTVFTRAQLVVMASIRDKSQSEITDIDGVSFTPPRVQRLTMVRLGGVLRVNERLASHPDLADRHFVLNVRASDPALDFGKTYVLMIDFRPNGPAWPWASPSPPSYSLVSNDPGFVVDSDNKVRPLKRSAALMAHDGESFGDLLKAIERGR